MPVEHVFFQSIDLVELTLDYGFAGKTEKKFTV